MTNDDGSGSPSVTGAPMAGAAAATDEGRACAEALAGAKLPSTPARANAHTDRRTTDRFIRRPPKKPLTRPPTGRQRL